EEANVVNQNRRPYNDPNSNTYNPGWRSHPNFGWGGNNNQQPVPITQGVPDIPPIVNNFSQSRQTQFQQGSSSYQSNKSFEDSVNRFIEMSLKTQETQTTLIAQNSQAISDLRSSVTRLTECFNINEKGRFPAQPVSNPQRTLVINDPSISHEKSPLHDQVQSISILRSGKKIDKTIHPLVELFCQSFFHS
uniref:hypothetical protein n=1 Tax=Bartonella sp. AC134YNZD TaxID=3243446 RepID=UPI0035D0130D